MSEEKVESPLKLQTESPDNDWRWKNTAGTQGFVHVSDQGVIELSVDDGHYSGWLSLEDSIAIARVVYSTSIAAMTPVPPEDVATSRDILDAVAVSVPEHYRVYRADPELGFWQLDEPHLLERRYLLRDLCLAGMRRFQMDPISTASVLLELSASLVAADGKLGEEDFVENARRWFVASSLATPQAITNTTGGQS